MIFRRKELTPADRKLLWGTGDRVAGFRHQAGILPLLVFAFNTFCYNVGGWLGSFGTYHVIRFPIDDLIPFLPWTITWYFGCYLFWIYNYLLIARLEKEKAYRAFCGEMSGKAVCFLFFVFLPTTIQRPEITGNGIFDVLMRFLYAIDAPRNLLPSIHCYVAWYCYIGIRGNKSVSPWYRIASLVMAIATCLVTVTTRQHLFIDIVAGVLLAEITYAVAAIPPILNGFTRLMDRVLPAINRFIYALYDKTHRKSVSRT